MPNGKGLPLGRPNLFPGIPTRMPTLAEAQAESRRQAQIEARRNAQIQALQEGTAPPNATEQDLITIGVLPATARRLGSKSLEEKETMLGEAFNIPPLPASRTGDDPPFISTPTDVVKRHAPLPPTPYPFGKNPSIPDAATQRRAARFFRLYPGMQETVSSISGTPNRLAIESAQESGFEPEDLPNLNIMGTFDEEPGNRSVYLRRGTGREPPYADTLAHELGHARNYGHPSANVLANFYRDYLQAMLARKGQK